MSEDSVSDWQFLKHILSQKHFWGSGSSSLSGAWSLLASTKCSPWPIRLTSLGYHLLSIFFFLFSFFFFWVKLLKYFLCVRDCAKCFAYIPNFILTTAKRDICILTYQMKKLRL